jgi:hypothetical protein
MSSSIEGSEKEYLESPPPKSQADHRTSFCRDSTRVEDERIVENELVCNDGEFVEQAHQDEKLFGWGSGLGQV